MSQRKRVLVTGSAGFLGSSFVRHIKHVMPDLIVVGLDRDLMSLGVDYFVNVDLNSANLGDALARVGPFEYVVHFAAMSYVHDSIDHPLVYVRDNVGGTVNLLQSLESRHRLRKFILISSCEVYGSSDYKVSETFPTHPQSPYAASKCAQENFFLAACHNRGIPGVICRLFNNYGRGQQSNRLIPAILRAASKSEAVVITGTGHQVRDWISVKDTCRALVEILTADLEIASIINVGSEETLSALQVVAMFEDLLRTHIEVEHVPGYPGHLEVSRSDNALLRSVTQWTPVDDFRSYFSLETVLGLWAEPKS